MDQNKTKNECIIHDDVMCVDDLCKCVNAKGMKGGEGKGESMIYDIMTI